MADKWRFNVRVYGILEEDGRVLVCTEQIRGRQVVKFPGGGLEYGEGTIDCLKREFREEMDMAIEVTRHFYTTDFFQPSAFDDSQVISIYYLVSRTDRQTPLRNLQPNEQSSWMEDISGSRLTLPIDQRVGDLLAEWLKGK